jgi:hypothetical protein
MEPLNNVFSQTLRNVLHLAWEPVAVKLQNRVTALARARALNILTACKDMDPDLVILCRGNGSLNVFGFSDDDWAIVRKRCYKLIFEIKKGR